MCQITPFIPSCCRHLYVHVLRLPSCPDEWPRRKCPSDLCILVGLPPVKAEKVECWRCKADKKGLSKEEREESRPIIDGALVVDGLEEYDVDGRRQNVEKQGNCWYCGAKGGCTSCGTTKIRVSDHQEIYNDKRDNILPPSKRKLGAAHNGKGPVARIKQEAGVRKRQTPLLKCSSPANNTHQKRSGYGQTSTHGRQHAQSFPFLDPGLTSQTPNNYSQGSGRIPPYSSYANSSQVLYSEAGYPASHDTQQPSPSLVCPSSDAASRLQSGYPQPSSLAYSPSAYVDPSKLSHYRFQDYNTVGHAIWGVPQAKSESIGDKLSYDGFPAAWHTNPDHVLSGTLSNIESFMTQTQVSQYPDPEDLDVSPFKTGCPAPPGSSNDAAGGGLGDSNAHFEGFDETGHVKLKDLLTSYNDDKNGGHQLSGYSI